MSSTHAVSYSDLKVLLESKMAKILELTQEKEKYKTMYFAMLKNDKVKGLSIGSLGKMVSQLKEDLAGANEETDARVVIEDIAHLFDEDEQGNDFDWESEIGGMVLENEKLKVREEALRAGFKLKDEMYEKVLAEGLVYYEELQELKAKKKKKKKKKKCEECGIEVEGGRCVLEGCPAYDKGWAETHDD
jgi:translation elongation factor EF-G